jgi:hypothetical protein
MAVNTDCASVCVYSCVRPNTRKRFTPTAAAAAGLGCLH